MSMNEHLDRYFTTATACGLSHELADKVRRDAERIATWDTHECNGNIQWAEEGQLSHRGRPLKAGRPYWVFGQDGPGAIVWTPTTDRYTPAMARVKAAADSIGAVLDYNGDPRGWPFTFKMPDGREFSPPVRNA